MKLPNKLPPFAVKGSDLPRVALFAELRDRWLAAGDDDPKRTTVALSKLLDVSLTKVSCWTTGSDGVAPWWVILRVAYELGLVVVLAPDSVSLVERSALNRRRS